MQKNHAKAIRGMSIANIILCALGILTYFVVVIVGGIGAAMVDSSAPSYSYDLDLDDLLNPYGYGYGNGHGHNNYYDYGASSSDIMIAKAALGFLSAFGVFGIICLGVCTAGAIITLKFHATPEKMGTIFVWSIVCAIVSFIFCGIAVTVLFIITAVFSNSDKKLYMSGLYYPGMPIHPQAAPQAAPYVQQPVYAQSDAAHSEVAAPVTLAAEPAAQPPTAITQTPEVQTMPVAVQEPSEVAQITVVEETVSEEPSFQDPDEGQTS